MSSRMRTPAREPWSQPAALVRGIRQQLRAVKTRPARFFWSETNYANASIVTEQLEVVVRDGWWTAEQIVLLTPMEERVMRLILRVKVGLEDFRGQLTAASIAHRCRYGERAVQLAIRHLEEIEMIQTERQLRAIVSIGVSNFFFQPEPPQRRTGKPAGIPKVSAQKALEIRGRATAQARERFLAEHARRAAEPGAETKKNADHVLSKSLSSERTPTSFGAAPAAAAAAAASPQPPLNGQKETPRSLGPGSPERPRPTADAPGPHGSAQRTNGNKRLRQRQQRMNDHSRRRFRDVAAGGLLTADELEEQLFGCSGPEPPS